MKPEDFLMALNDADDAYVKKAGLKGGYLSMYSEAGIQKTEQSDTTRNLRQETAKQRNVKRFWLAAACLALVAVSCGAWMLLKDRLAPGGASVGASVGTSPSQSVTAATEDVITPTEKPAPTEGSEPSEAPPSSVIDTSADTYIRICEESVLCVHESTKSDVIHSLLTHKVLLNLCDYEASEVENQPYLADAASGALVLQRGLGAELAALDAQNPENVFVIHFRGTHCDENYETDCVWDQYFFAIHDEDGSWVVVDATEAKQVPLTEADSLKWIREHLSYAPTSFGNLRGISQAMDKISDDPRVTNCIVNVCRENRSDTDSIPEDGIYNIQTLFGWNGEQVREMLERPEEYLWFCTVEFTVDFDEEKTTYPDVTVSQELYYVLLENELMALFDSSELTLVTP